MTVRPAAIAVAVFVAAGFVAGTASIAGCAHHGHSPSDVVRDFAVAIERGDHAHAYALMSSDYRRRVSLEKFRAEIDAERQNVIRDAAALAHASLRPAHAQVETRAGDRVPLTLEGDGWRLGEQPLVPFGQQSPRAALRTFVRAVTERRYDIVLRLVPGQHRPRITESMLRIYWEGPDSGPHRRLLDLLRMNLEAPIIELGTEAQMPYGPGNQHGEHREDEGEVRFLLEGGVWKIDDAD